LPGVVRNYHIWVRVPIWIEKSAALSCSLMTGPLVESMAFFQNYHLQNMVSDTTEPQIFS
ncbi:hypothetical protein T03_11536, partial [Trichinella britovi]